MEQHRPWHTTTEGRIIAGKMGGIIRSIPAYERAINVARWREQQLQTVAALDRAGRARLEQRRLERAHMTANATPNGKRQGILYLCVKGTKELECVVCKGENNQVEDRIVKLPCKHELAQNVSPDGCSRRVHVRCVDEITRSTWKWRCGGAAGGRLRRHGHV